MDVLYDFGIEIIRWLQANYPQLETLMVIVSELGRFEFFLAVLPLIYWCLNKALGKQLSYLLSIGYVLNTYFKHTLRSPRPFWLEPDLRIVEEPHYGIPSGHTQNTTIFYLLLAFWIRRGWFWLLALLMIFLTALSRVYLGVHFVQDVFAGLLLGLLVLAGYLVWRRSFQESFRNRILGQRLLLTVLVPAVLGAIYVVSLLLLGEIREGLAWDRYLALAERTSMEDMATALGILSGLGVGFILEATRVHFMVAGTVLKRVLRYLLGIVIAVAIWQGLGQLFPDDPLWLALPLRFLRYTLAGLWIAYYAPLVFVRIGLAEPTPEPEISLTVSEGSIMRG